MAIYEDLLNSAIGAQQPTASTEPVNTRLVMQADTPSAVAKQQELLAASAQKKAELSGTGSGMSAIPDMYQVAVGMGNQSGAGTMSPMEQDLRTLDPIELRLKYGNAAGDLLRSQADANAQVMADRTQSRSPGEFLYDTTSGIATGAINGLAGLGSWGAGLINPEWGTTSAGWINDATQWVEGTQSDAVNAARRVQRTKSMLDARDNAAQYKDELSSGTPQIVAEFNQWGRNLIDSVANSDDPTMFAQGTAEGIGSIFAGGILSKGIRGLGAIARTTLGRAGVLNTEGAAALSGASNASRVAQAADTFNPSLIGSQGTAALSRWGGNAAWPLSVAGMEGGGAYQGAATEVMEKPFSDLEKNSPAFREEKARLIATGMSEKDANEQARIEVANSAGIRAAVIQAPIAGPTGILTRYAEHPFHVPSVGSAVRNVFVNEPLEEFIQSSTGQLAQNIGVRDFGDQNQSYAEGVGEQGVLGALYGMGTAGAVQAPGAAARATYQGGRAVYRGGRMVVDKAVAAGRPYFNALVEMGERRLRQAEKAGTVGIDSLKNASADLTARADEYINSLKELVQNSNATPEEKERDTKFADSLASSTVVSPEEVSTLTPNEQTVVSGSTDRVDAIEKLADHASKQKDGSKEQLFAIAALQKLMDPLMKLKNSSLSAMGSVSDNDTAQGILKGYHWLANNIDNNQTVKRVLNKFDSLISTQSVDALADTITDQNISTPEGQQAAQAVVDLVEARSDAASPKTINTILKHAASGNLNLTDQQKASLNASLSILNAREEQDKAADALGLVGNQRPMDVVSRQVVSASDPLNKSTNLKKSARQHTDEIRSLLAAGNIDEAAAQLEDFGLFVQHMQNKVQALNESVGAGQIAGPKVQYEALSPTAGRKWYTDKKGLDVDLSKPGSVRFAQQVGLEAETLAKVYNGLVNAYPSLNQKEITPASLDPRLNRPAADVVTEARGQQQSAPAPTKQSAEQPKAAPAEARAHNRAPKLEAKESGTQAPATPAPEAKGAVESQAKQVEELPILAMQPDNVKKILSGEKTATSRTKELKNGRYRLPDGSIISLSGSFVSNIDQLSDPESWANAEGFQSLSAFRKNAKYQHTKDFIDGKRGLYIYRITVQTNQVEANESGAQPKSRITEEQAARLSDAGLNARIEAIQNKKEKTDEDRATFTVLDAEMTKREDAAVAAQKAEEQSEVSEAKSEIAPQVNQEEQTTPPKEAETTPAVEEMVQEEEQAPSVPQAENNAINAAYPGLITSIKNYFLKVMKLLPGDQAPTRTMLDPEGRDPVTVVRDALDSSVALEQHLGKKPKHHLSFEIADSYQRLLRNTANFQKKFAEVRSLLSQKTPLNFKQLGRVKALGTDLTTVGSIMETMKINLSAFLSKDAIQGYLDTNEREVQRLVNGKALNIVNEDFTYNEPLLQSAAMAGMQWLLTAQQNEQIMEEQEFEALTGLRAEEHGTLVEMINQGMSMEDMKRRLTPKIMQFWGVRADRNADMAYAEGIPEAVASEVLRALVAIGAIEEITTTLTEDDGLPPRADGKPNVKKISRYKIRAEIDPSINAYPNAIEEAVVFNPEEVRYIDGDIPPVANSQMNNPGIRNTRQQKAALKSENSTEHFANLPMMHLYASLGRVGMQTLFGAGNLENRVLNKNYAKSLDGQNRNVLSSFDEIFATLAEMNNRAQQSGKSLAETAIRYAYNMSRVGRMQMLGKYNPQANKQMREAILPTWATLDLAGNQQHQRAYTLAMAQALGISVHKNSYEVNAQKLESLLSGSLAPAVELLREWANQTDLESVPSQEEAADIPAAQLKQAFDDAGVDLTAVALHALVDYNRKRAATDLSKFRTALYLEADGVTNGPINAMVMATIGNFTKNWVQNTRKGGLSFGPAAALYSLDGATNDLYQTSTDNTKTALVQMKNLIRNQKDRKYILENVTALHALMGEFLDGAVTYKMNDAGDDGELTLTRKIAKNPLTITIYGSSEFGIAGKLTEMITDSLYKRLSDAATAMSKNPDLSPAEAMFPGENSEARYNLFLKNLNTLSSTALGWNSKEMKYFRGGDPENIFSFSKNDIEKQLVDFTLNRAQIDNLRTNMRFAFVQPMRKGITETVGNGLMSSMDRLRKASQVQSIFLQYAYRAEINRVLQEKNEADPTRVSGDFISRADLDKIDQELRKKFPVIETNGQIFQIAKSRALVSAAQENGSQFQYGRGFNDFGRTPAEVYVPSNSGVAGQPFMIIGMGDARMMQNLALDSDIKGTLKIFDGMNMPLDKISDYGVKANKAAYESWMGNPLQAVYDAYAQFMGMNEKEMFSNFSKEMGSDLARALKDEEISADLLADLPNIPEDQREQAILFDQMQGLKRKMLVAAISVEARHRVMQEMNISVDQMAAAEAPYATGTTDQVVDDDRLLAQIRARYSEIYKEMMAEAQKEVPSETLSKDEQPTPTEVKDSPFLKVGREDKLSGARVLSWTAIKNVARGLTFTEGQKAIFDQIIRSLGTKEYTMVVGNIDQITAYQDERGLSGLDGDNEGVNGYISIGDRTIYLLNPTAETFVHELVHAATYETIAAYYRGEDLGENSAVVKEAIARMETLMQDFMNEEISSVAPYEVQEAVANAKAAIQQGLDMAATDPAAGKAKALNEFMAWGLANAEMANVLKAKKVPLLVQLGKDILKAIKSLIWGRKQAPKPADDALSNLQFNAGVIIRTQPSLSQLFTEATLHHAVEGANERLTRVREMFDTAVAQHLAEREVTEPAAAEVHINVAVQFQTAVQEMADKAAVAFGLSQAEITTLSAVVSALATEANFDTNALGRIQELYQYVTKNMKVEDFMTGDTVNPDVDSHYALEKYNLILGRGTRLHDAYGQTTLMSTFLGLALVSEEFRKVLNKMPVPKVKMEGANLDEKLQNVASGLMDRLSARLAGEGNAPNVRAALDALSNHIYKTVHDEQTALSQASDYAAQVGNTINDRLVSLLQAASTKGVKLGKRIHGNSGSKIRELTGSFITHVSALASESESEKVAEGLLHTLIRVKLNNPMMSIAKDLVGRTDATGDVYDMIKRVRAMVQQLRQQFREKVPQIIASKFKTAPTTEQWATMFRSMGKTDLAALSDLKKEDLLKLFTDEEHFKNLQNKLGEVIEKADPKNASLIFNKAWQLADYMRTGKPGPNLLRNAHAIAHLWNEPKAVKGNDPSKEMIAALDQLITLMSLSGLADSDKKAMASLVKNEPEGISFLFDYLTGQRKSELDKAKKGKVLANHYKGYIPSTQQPGIHLTIEDDSRNAELVQQGYVRVGNYIGSSIYNRGTSKGYYFTNAPGRAPFAQGLIQNVKHTASGVDASTGFSTGMVAGRIYSKVLVQNLAKNLHKERSGMDNLMPLFDENGNVIALEQSVDPIQLARLKNSEQIHQMVGVWRGRQVEEKWSSMVNQELIGKLKDQYQTMLKNNPTDKDLYVNLFDYSKLDRVQQDAVDLIPDDVREMIEEAFGKGRFMVRADQLEDVVGYRNPSVSDFWTGNNRFSKETNEEIRKALVGVFGVKLLPFLVKAEKAIQGFVSDMRTLIVVKSVIVPVANFLSNTYQLLSRGVGPVYMAKRMPAKLAEINTYVKSRLRQIELEAELRAVGDDVRKESRLRAEIRSITDSHKRLAIWPLIEAGEFSTIADVGMTAEDLEITSGRIGSYIESKVDKLPPGLKTAARYGLITRDTALFQGLQRSVQYGDFLAKAVLYDHLTQRKNVTKTDALKRITEEFVNFERLPGRTRGYLENMGLLWFYNFKLRIAKVALSTLRNNPLHALIAMSLPAPTGVGMPIGDNIVSKFVGGGLSYSIGPEMAFRAWTLNPWYNLVD